ncbi:MAG TPA: NAD-glutamate dehydrogenase [Gammaproteobacteria bacterium]|jgi:glutamate dehydrogenase|nr:NAD-glutamate dehydrogenase [Gammaproteobacteria bacterium]
MPQRKSPPKDKHLEKVIALAEKHPAAAALKTFILQYYDDIAEEDILSHTPEDLLGAALSHWEFGAKRARGETKVRVFNPSPKKDGWKSAHTIIEMVNDDMPFLVDTTTMTLSRLGVGIHLTVHPIYYVQRDARGLIAQLSDHKQEGAVTESWMHIEVDSQAGAETLAKIETGLQSAMRDVRATIGDWQAMRDKLKEVRDTVPAHRSILGDADVDEGVKFLEWLGDNHFTFLGVREYVLGEENGEEVLKLVPNSGLGILRDTNAKISQSFLVLPKDVRKRARAKEFMIVTKANSQATVHRPGYLDYVGVKRFGADGQVTGEWRFLGLFTTSAYAASPRDIPVLREKVAAVMRRSELPLGSHDGKALMHILETLPRDELFQSTTDELFETAMGVVQLQERQRVKLFVRRDSFGRFFSCLIYVPRDRYTTAVRQRIESILFQALNGKSVEHAVALSESALARLHVIVRTTPWQLPKYDRLALEQDIVLAVRSWQDELKNALVEGLSEEQGLKLFARYGNHFPGAYQDDIKPKAAVFDVEQVDALNASGGLRMSLYRPFNAPPGYLRFKTFHREQTIPISDALPMLENMGVRVISERPYEMDLADGSIVWIQDFELVHPGELDVDSVKDAFQEQFARVWRGEAESDGFNRLVLSAGLSWRQTMLLRAYCKYLLQTGISFSQAYMERALYTHPAIAASLVHLFEARNDPQGSGKRDSLTEKHRADIAAALEQVSSLDDDRILRLFLGAILATLRSNYYQKDADGANKSHVSFKFDPAQLELPLPKPLFEIWVYSPRVEGVHLRMGKVARGGLRWSDRREDFRTEVLGLVKAQNVKNTVIVPVGAKGGFYVKRPPAAGDREAIMKEGIACYQTFLRGLLDVTDNLSGTKVIPPKDVVRHDPDDPYLVVAADKGTASFSDIANGISAEYGFWLGDAFASGGSVGYDHKKMAITAKGGWESVKRHFREMGTDIQSTDFTVAGIGDMSGDVFGNGMLLSRHIRLVAAFDHRHVFLDPNPDAEKSFKERERMFNLPRSSWADYEAKLISAGGGIWPRTAKSIPLSKEAATVLGAEPGNYAPTELLRVILKAPVDLLWNGGIGTYIKAGSESHAEVGDRANDAIRLNGSELRCKVVGEGGNLGCTQRGRIEYSLAGGRINTDFIDNSAGVDCSDHEVNIKILLTLVAAEKTLNEAARNKLLAEMTDEVAALVLRDNYLQAQAISVAEVQAPGRISEHAYLIRALEKGGVLSRAIEFLPTDEALAERRKSGRGLTRPELAVVLAYSKIDIYNGLLAGDVAEDPYLAQELENYFPTPLQKRYAELMPKHRLRREIICTAVTNSIVNRMGSTFAHRMQEETGVDASTVARAYAIAQESFSMPALWEALEALDNKVPASVQISMAVQSSRLLKHVTRWLIDHQRDRLDIAATVPVYQPGLSALVQHMPAILNDSLAETFNQGVQQYVDVGVPDILARRIAAIGPLYAGLDIVDVARETKLPVEMVAKVYFQIGSELGLSWLRVQIEELSVDGHWQAVARGTLREDLYVQQRALTAQALNGAKDSRSAIKQMEKWLETHAARLDHARHILADMKAANIADFPSLSVALQEIRKLARLN